DVAADVEAEDAARLLLRVGRVVGEPDAAGLAAPAGQHLRLDDDGAAEAGRRGPRLLGRDGEPPVGDGDADAPEELLALVLVEIHRRSTLAAGTRPARREPRRPRAGTGSG